MGLTTWKNAPYGPVRKADVSVAKNYLEDAEITELNRIVTMYLDYAEDQAKRKKPMHMTDWVEKLDAFRRFNEREVLGNPGQVSSEIAKEHAHAQYEIFEKRRLADDAERPSSDFDQLVEGAKKVNAKLPKPKNGE